MDGWMGYAYAYAWVDVGIGMGMHGWMEGMMGWDGTG